MGKKIAKMVPTKPIVVTIKLIIQITIFSLQFKIILTVIFFQLEIIKLKSCQALETVGRFSRHNEMMESTDKTNKLFNSAYLIEARPGHVIWLNFKTFETQLASVQVPFELSSSY